MTGQEFVMVMMALFVGFGIGYVIFNGSKQNSSISVPQAASGTPQAPIADAVRGLFSGAPVTQQALRSPTRDHRSWACAYDTRGDGHGAQRLLRPECRHKNYFKATTILAQAEA